MSGYLRIYPFSLRDTLESGQFFRFTRLGGSYLIQSHHRIFSLSQKGDLLFYEGVDKKFLTEFLRLNDDMGQILREIDRDPVIHQAIRKYSGMRLIRQDPWECLLSFLCSSVKSIPQIRVMIEALCQSSGEKIRWKEHVGYGFPEPRSIQNPFQLESVRAGFRTDYLIQTHRCIDRRQLLALKGFSYHEARKILMELPGVGKKVADCTLLYSLDFLKAFPIDTWIKKGLQKIYFNGRKVGDHAVEEFVSDHFGPYAGYAQLYLYHFWRNHP